MGSLSEIRHKTAVSTIRSTTDRSIRERPRQRIEETRKKPAQKKDVARGKVLTIKNLLKILNLIDSCTVNT